MKTAVFLIVISLVELAAYLVIAHTLRAKNGKKPRRLLAALCFAAVFLLTLRFAMFPPHKELPVSGGCEVASTDYWVTEEQEDPYLGGGRLRQLQVRKWYPANGEAQSIVIVASHGSCGTADNNLSLYKELASRGYTVLAVVHPGQAAKVTYENGKSAGPSMRFLRQMSADSGDDPAYLYEVFREWMDIRTGDLNAVMDDYAKKEGAGQFLVMGHSLGGSAAYAMARIRTDVVGCIALEAPFLYDIKGVQDGKFVFDSRDYDIPLLNVYSDSSFPHLRELPQYENNVKFLAPGAANCTNLHYEGVGHMGLCDLSIYSPLLAAMLDRDIQKTDAYAQLETLNADCVAWIERNF